MSFVTLEKSGRRGRKTWSWSGKDSEGNTVSVSFPREGSGIGGVCKAVLQAGSQVPMGELIKSGRAGSNLWLHKSLVGYRKRFWDMVEKESKSSKYNGCGYRKGSCLAEFKGFPGRQP